MKPLLLWNAAYFDALLLKAGLLTVLFSGGLAVLIAFDQRRRATRPRVPPPAPPAWLLDRLNWLERVLLGAVLLVFLLQLL